MYNLYREGQSVRMYIAKHKRLPKIDRKILENLKLPPTVNRTTKTLYVIIKHKHSPKVREPVAKDFQLQSELSTNYQQLCRIWEFASGIKLGNEYVLQYLELKK